MTRRMTSWSITLAGAVVFIVAACGGSSTGTAAPASGSVPSAAASVAAPSVEASVAPSLLATETLPGSSVAIPSFALPNDDKGLEALLPDEMCGQKATKLSFSGDRFFDASDETLKATLAAIGKTAKDVSMAVAAGPIASGGLCSTTAAVFRVKGADPNQLRDAYLAEAAKQSQAQTQANVGGKDVWIGVSEGGDVKTYGYIKGDAIFLVVAKDDAAAAPVLQVMP